MPTDKTTAHGNQELCFSGCFSERCVGKIKSVEDKKHLGGNELTHKDALVDGVEKC